MTAPQASLPNWPDTPGDVDTEGVGFLIIAIASTQEVRDVADAWLSAASRIAVTRTLMVASLATEDDRLAVEHALAEVRTGERIMVVGGQHDVLVAVTAARTAGALPTEITAFVTHTGDLPLYCAHCRDTHRVLGAPGDVVVCPGCQARVAIHEHFSAARGSFLASSAEARSLV